MAIEHKRSKNERLGKIPYGWRLDEDGKTLVPDVGELEVLALIRHHHQQDLSLRGISKALEEEGILARHASPLQPARSSWS